MVDLLEGQLNRLARPIAEKLAEVANKMFPVPLPPEQLKEYWRQLLDKFMPDVIERIKAIDIDKLMRELRELWKKQQEQSNGQ